MTLARAARRPPRQIAELIVKHFPSLREVERVDVAGPGFLNVFLSPAWCATALRDVLASGAEYGRGADLGDQRVRLEFVSANPTGPLVIVSARAAAVGDSLARLLRAKGAQVTTEYYVNDAGTQFEALARSFEARVAQEFGEPATLPENGYPGEYLIELARAYRAEGRARPEGAPERERLEHFGRYAVSRIVEQQRRILRDYGVEFDVWTSEQRDVRDRHLPEQALEELAARKLTYAHEGALWFRSPELGEEAGDDKHRVLGRSTGRAADLAAAPSPLLPGRQDRALERHVGVATRQSAENPVYYVQYARARIESIYKQAAEQGIVVPPLGDIDLSPLREGEELAIIKRLLQYPDVAKAAARALEPHRVAYFLQELAGIFHPYYKSHRVIQDDRRLMFAPLALGTRVGRVVPNGLQLLRVSAPESM